jgi:DNA-binding beta-propeller fold protein YncE
MNKKMFSRIITCIAVVLAGFTSGCKEGNVASPKSSKPSLFLALPDKCNTPDGATLDPSSGNIILACPNFNDPNWPGILMKIDPSNNATQYFAMPIHPETKRGCPMGLDFGPDGNLYVADNQYFYDKDHKSRLIRVVIENGTPVRGEVAVDGFKLSNAVIWKGDSVYVSDTFFDLPDKPGASGIYRIKLSEMQKGTVQLKPNATDPHLIAAFTTAANAKNEMAGADGLTFDSKGNLYTGNFGDGAFSKITFDNNGNVLSNKILVKDPRMTCVDGIFCDLKTDEIYVADSERNAIHVISPQGDLRTLWKNDDNDGSDGLLDQPCEPLIRGNELIVVNFDMPFPGLMNSVYDKYHTLSVIKLK